MSCRGDLDCVRIDAYVVDGLVQAHFAKVIAAGHVSEDVLRQRIDEESSFMSDARRAAADAILYSALAGTLQDDQDFVGLIEQQEDFSDPFFSAMRQALFAAGIETARKTLSASVSAWQVLDRRARLYLQQAQDSSA
jgi:hypothetical protein